LCKPHKYPGVWDRVFAQNREALKLAVKIEKGLAILFLSVIMIPARGKQTNHLQGTLKSEYQNEYSNLRRNKK